MDLSSGRDSLIFYMNRIRIICGMSSRRNKRKIKVKHEQNKIELKKTLLFSVHVCVVTIYFFNLEDTVHFVATQCLQHAGYMEN